MGLHQACNPQFRFDGGITCYGSLNDYQEESLICVMRQNRILLIQAPTLNTESHGMVPGTDAVPAAWCCF